jgi:hypothetical protein
MLKLVMMRLGLLLQRAINQIKGIHRRRDLHTLYKTVLATSLLRFEAMIRELRPRIGDSVTVQASTEVLSQVSTRALKILSMHERICLGFQTNAILLLVYPTNIIFIIPAMHLDCAR